MAAAQDYIACRFADKQVFYHLSNERAHVIKINVTDGDGIKMWNKTFPRSEK